MTSKPTVERQFRFRCSCGAITITGERSVICAGCGDTLGIRRVRRRQQRRDSVAYYGRTIPVRRSDGRTQQPNRAAIAPSEAIFSKFSAWLKRLLTHPPVIQVTRFEIRPTRTNAAQRAEGERIKRAPPMESRKPIRSEDLPRRAILEGAHVRVKPFRPDGLPHPHAGKTGRITKFANEDSAAPLSAMVRLDAGVDPGGYICVSLVSLELLT